MTDLICRNIWLSTSSQLQPSTSTVIKEDKYKESIMKLYQLLMNKRYELASIQDCMPYTIASNAALMEMAKQKPVSLEQLRKCQRKISLVTISLRSFATFLFQWKDSPRRKSPSSGKNS